ncbi:MAG: prepilin-type N-terminal cleavage/methylation domain-containing protein [Planctomycetota bacterium]|nr:prepilin-type N-terminal cleavage/methylation domain-containing protein [Planctomycetota bacterium]
MRTHLLHRRLRRPSGFSLIEMLVALAISGLMLTAAMVALDSSFKGYKITTDSASTHVVSRLVMTRLSSMIRTGTEFAPFPEDVFDMGTNPVRDSEWIEFVSQENEAAGTRRVIRLESRAVTSADPAIGPRQLWYVQMDFVNGQLNAQVERPLITNLERAAFTLEYEPGPRLRRATIDLTIRPNDAQAAAFHSNTEANTIRLVSTVIPRRLD